MENKNIIITDRFLLRNAIHTIDFKNKRVLLRVDLNVPIIDKKILNDYKFLSILPTIQMLLQKEAKIIIATHLGNPKKYFNPTLPPTLSQAPTPDKKLSTDILVPLFKKEFSSKGYNVLFEPNLDEAIKKSKCIKEYDMLLLENIRFFKGEKEKKLAPAFAKKLVQLGDYFVNDAFGACHRDDTSITLVPELFGKQKIFVGLLVEHELHELQRLCKRPAKNFTFVIGGGKVSYKLPLIEDVLNKVDTILLCPAITFTFLKYLGKDIGNSLVDDTLLPIIPKILSKAKKKKVKLVYPKDYIIAKDTFDGPIKTMHATQIPDNFIGVSIGPKTAKLFSEIIRNSKTVFLNGAPGNVKNKKTLKGIEKIFKAMGKGTLFSVIAGGDSVALAYMMNVAKNIDYLSTGGGAALAFFCNKKLPGLAIFQA